MFTFCYQLWLQVVEERFARWRMHQFYKELAEVLDEKNKVLERFAEFGGAVKAWKIIQVWEMEQ